MIYTECKPDSALVRTLGIRKKINIDIRKFEKLIDDLKGKSRMLKALENSIKERRMK